MSIAILSFSLNSDLDFLGNYIPFHLAFCVSCDPHLFLCFIITTSIFIGPWWYGQMAFHFLVNDLVHSKSRGFPRGHPLGQTDFRRQDKFLKKNITQLSSADIHKHRRLGTSIQLDMITIALAVNGRYLDRIHRILVTQKLLAVSPCGMGIDTINTWKKITLHWIKIAIHYKQENCMFVFTYTLQYSCDFDFNQL